MKGKGLFIACGVVCVMASACLIGGDYSAFGGALIVAAVLLAVALLKRRRAPQTPAQAPVAVPCETAAAEPVPSTPEPVADGIRVITGKCGRMTVQETVSHVLFVPVKNRKINARAATALVLGTKKFTAVPRSLIVLKRLSMNLLPYSTLTLIAGLPKSAVPAARNIQPILIGVPVLTSTNGVNRASTYISLPCKWDIAATIFIPANFQRLLFGAAFFMPLRLSAARSAFRFHAAGFRMPGPPPLLSLPRFPSCGERQAKAAF